MLESRAKRLEREGKCLIHNGAVHFYADSTHAGYDRAPGYARFSGSISFDPDRGGGPNVIQFFRTNRGRKGAA